MLLTPYYQFDLFEIPQCFLNLQTEYYKKKCNYCDKERVDSATCLLCGQTMCWFKQKDGGCKGFTSDVGGVGLISYHTSLHEGGHTAFLQTSTGNVIMIQNGTSAQFDTPYRNNYGELANTGDKRWDQFNIDEQGGGKEALQQIKKKYMDFQIANTILSQRLNPDEKYKVYIKNVL